MPLDLVKFEAKTNAAIKTFWSSANGVARRRLTGGNAMRGFGSLVGGIVQANGLAKTSVLVHDQPVPVVVPGHFSPFQLWDIVVVNEGRLVAAIKFDFQIGASLTDHAARNCREILGMSMELKAAYRKGTFGRTRQPFVGYLVLVEDAPVSRMPFKDISPNFPLSPEFRDASYAERYNILCQKLMAESLYSAASVILSPRAASKTGAYSEMNNVTGLKQFVTTLAGHIAAEAAM